MVVGIYVHGDSRLAEIIHKDLQSKGTEATFEDFCLCQCPNLKASDLPSLVLLHPADTHDTGCYDGIRNIVEKSPDVEFYIFVMGKWQREEGIGYHENVHYFDYHNVMPMMREFLQRAGGL